MNDTKTCSKCKKDLELNCFYKRGEGNRLRSACKDCTNNRAKELYPNHREKHQKLMHEYYINNRAYCLEYSAKYQKSEKGKIVSKKSSEKWKENNRHKKRAHYKVSDALRAGKLIKKPCSVCGSDKKFSHAHHNDYNKPLDIIWLCAMHHRIVHRRIDESKHDNNIAIQVANMEPANGNEQVGKSQGY